MKKYDATQIAMGIPESDARSEATRNMTTAEVRDWYEAHYPLMAAIFVDWQVEA